MSSLCKCDQFLDRLLERDVRELTSVFDKEVHVALCVGLIEPFPGDWGSCYHIFKRFAHHPPAIAAAGALDARKPHDRVDGHLSFWVDRGFDHFKAFVQKVGDEVWSLFITRISVGHKPEVLPFLLAQAPVKHRKHRGHGSTVKMWPRRHNQKSGGGLDKHLFGGFTLCAAPCCLVFNREPVKYDRCSVQECRCPHYAAHYNKSSII